MSNSQRTINLLVIVNLYFRVIRFRPDIFEWFLSTLFDASLLELKAAFPRLFFVFVSHGLELARVAHRRICASVLTSLGASI